MDFAPRFDAIIDRAIAEQRVVGTVVVAAREEREVYRRAAGFADREAEIPVRPDTIFRLASVTKPIVAAATLVLVDKGRLGLDMPVTDALPDFTPKLPDGRQPTITLHHLLTHTAGLGYGGTAFARAGVSGGLANDDITLEETVARLATVPLTYEPGTAWEYSMAIDVLGAIIAAVEKTTLGEAVARYVTGPLGMDDTLFGVADRNRLAAAYANTDDGAERMQSTHPMKRLTGDDITFFPERIFNPNAFQSGGAGMAGTAPDFLHLLNALVSADKPLLSPELTKIALSDRIGQLVREKSPGEGFSYLGAVIRDPGKAGVPCTEGANRWGGVYGNSWLLDPTENLAVAAFTNTALEGCEGRFRDEIRDAYYQQV